MYRKRYSTTVATAIAVLMLATSCGSTPEAQGVGVNILDGDVVTGFATDQPGFGSLDVGRNEFLGFDIDTAQWLADNMQPHFKITGTPVPTSARVSTLAPGSSTKMVVQSFSITEERLRSIDMAGPYLYTYPGVLVRDGDQRLFQNELDLKGKTVCTLIGSTTEPILRARGALITPDYGIKQCLDRLRSKGVQAVSTDQILLYGYARSESGLAVTPLTFGQRQEYGIGLPFGNLDTCRRVTEALIEYIKSGEWDRFIERNLGSIDKSRYRPDWRNLNQCPVRAPGEKPAPAPPN